MSTLPYFKILLDRLEVNDPTATKVWGRHVHWGYWEDPSKAKNTPEDFAEAAEALCEYMFNVAGIRDGMRILDVGCGLGGTIASLNDRFSDLTMVGVNIDPLQLERAREAVVPRAGNSVSFLECNGNDLLSLDQEPFDVIFAVECIFHFDRPAFFDGARQLLKPEGCVVVSDYTTKSWSRPFYRIADSLLFGKSTKETYGDLDISWNQNMYANCAEDKDLKLSEFHDITKNTLPTYHCIRALMKDWQESFDRPNWALELGSRYGFLQYPVIRFDVANAKKSQNGKGSKEGSESPELVAN